RICLSLSILFHPPRHRPLRKFYRSGQNLLLQNVLLFDYKCQCRLTLLLFAKDDAALRPHGNRWFRRFPPPSSIPLLPPCALRCLLPTGSGKCFPGTPLKFSFKKFCCAKLSLCGLKDFLQKVMEIKSAGHLNCKLHTMTS